MVSSINTTQNQKKIEPLKIKYHLPVIGQKEIIFYGEAQKVLNFLISKNIISRLGHQKQLGIISELIHTAHHPKLEFVYLQVYIADRLKYFKGMYPLNTKIDKGRNLTGSELIKIWAVLLAMGHLPGTFAVEKAVLKHLFFNEKSRNEFIKPIRNQKIKNECEEIILSQNLYGFYSVISQVVINRFNHNLEQIRVGDSMSSLLHLYTTKPLTNKIDLLKDLYIKIRRYSAIFLDGYYTGGLNTLKNEDLEKIVDPIEGEVFNELQKKIEYFLNRDIYKNQYSIVAENSLYKAIYEQLAKKGDGIASIRYIDNLMYESKDFGVFNSYRKYASKNKLLNKKYTEIFNIDVRKQDVFEIEENIQSIIDEADGGAVSSDILIHVDKRPRSKNAEIFLFIDMSNRSINLTCIKEMFSYLLDSLKLPNTGTELNHDHILGTANDTRIVHMMINSLQEQYVEKSLTRLFKGLFRIIFSNHITNIKFRSEIKNTVKAYSDSAAYRFTELVIKNIEIDNQIKRYEAITTCNIAKKIIEQKKDSLVFVSLNNTELFLDTNVSVAEFDGSILELTKNREMFLYIIEAKKRRKSCYDITKKQLTGLKKLFRNKEKFLKKTKIHRLIDKNSAYLKVNIT